MDVKNGDGARHSRKKSRKSDEDEKWECSVCTYINPKEAYKCEMCFMRKGTSTRKPRPNPQVLEQQQLIAQAILKEKDEEHRKRKYERNSDKALLKDRNIKLKNFDRSSPLLFEVFAKGYSVIITEFPPKTKRRMTHCPESPAASNCSSLLGFSGTTSAIPEQPSPTDSNSTTDAAARAFAFADSEHSDGPDGKSKLSLRSSQPNLIGPNSRAGSSDQLNRVASVNPISTPSPYQTTTTQSSNSNHDRIGTGFKPSDRRLKRNQMRSNRGRRGASRLTKSTFRSNILTAKRPSGSNEMKLIISPRRKRVISDDAKLRARSYPAKRRRTGTSRSTFPLTSTRTRSTRAITDYSLNDTTSIDNKASVSRDTFISPVSMNSPAPVDTKQRLTVGKRPSSTPVDLRCKIRMSALNVSQPELSPNKRFSSPSKVPRDGLLDQSISGEVPMHGSSRLSSESKNTSAMTDSAGATALEMSG